MDGDVGTFGAVEIMFLVILVLVALCLVGLLIAYCVYQRKERRLRKEQF